MSDRRFAQVPMDPAALGGEDSPPPRLVGMILDRPMPESADNLSIEVMPRLLGHALLFGRQTDRPARIEVQSLVAWDVEPVKAWLRELGGGNLQSEAEQQVAGRTSGSHQLLMARWCRRGAGRDSKSRSWPGSISGRRSPSSGRICRWAFWAAARRTRRQPTRPPSCGCWPR